MVLPRKSEDWGTNEEINEFAEETTLNVAVHIHGETQPRIVTMVSEDEHYFPAPKINGDEFIRLDTCSGVSCFNRLRLYDIIDWSNTGNLRIGIRGQLLRVQRLVHLESNKIHFCEVGVNVLTMSSLVKAGWSMRVGLKSTQLYRYDLYTSSVVADLWLILRDRIRPRLLAAKRYG